MKSETTVMVIHQTAAHSVIKNITTYLMIVAVIGTGWALDSQAMQWVGFGFVLLIGLGRAVAGANKSRFTPQEAADRLKEEFGVVARGESDPGEQS